MHGKTPYNSLGFTLAIVGTAVTLLWIGLFKFTPTEAKDIQDVVKHSRFMSWLNLVLSVQGVSNFVGTFEIITALLLVLQLFWKQLSIIAGLLGCIIFLITISFLFSTPGMFTTVDGLLIANGFILKDIALLGVCLQVFINGLKKTDQKPGKLNRYSSKV
ncbi:MAG: DUF417 family protein [Chitinophagaceae bacterium]|nr:DUF417 family protein [Chitinophagaceae bacterium]